MSQTLSTIYDQYKHIPKRFKCEVCRRRGLTLIESAKGFRCVCGNRRSKTFWIKPFVGLPDPMTFSMATKAIGANPTGSTLREALRLGRVRSAGHSIRVNGVESRRDRTITRDELIRYYIENYNHRSKKSNNKGRANHKHG